MPLQFAFCSTSLSVKCTIKKVYKLLKKPKATKFRLEGKVLQVIG